MEIKEKEMLFLKQLALYNLPCPQTYSDWYAARIFYDSINDHKYNIEQWVDYLKLKHKYPYFRKNIEKNKSIII